MTTTTVQTTDLTTGLARVLQQTFTVYQRTHVAHWNVRGPHFPHLHKLFEEHYTELWEALDALAERVRSYGVPVPADVLTAAPVDLPGDAMEIVRSLAADHRAIAGTLRALEAQAAELEDPGTADLATERVRAHDQMAWMLEATAN